MKPTIGRIVHLYSQTVADRNPKQPGYGFNGLGAGPYPAIVTQLFKDGDGNISYCNLKVFPPFAPPFDEGSVAEKDSTFFQPGRYWEWPPREETPPVAAPFVQTVYELSSGAWAVSEVETRRFTAPEGNDAVTRFAERVTEFDRNPDVSAGWVKLSKIDGDVVTDMLGWTKTSDERPTSEGEIVPKQA